MSSIALSRPMIRVKGTGMRDSGRSADAASRRLPPRLVEALGEQSCEVAGHLLLEVGGGVEREVCGRVVGADPADQLAEAVVAVLRGLDVDELGHGCRCEVVLVLQIRDLFVGRDPAVAVAVDADEDIGLRDVRAIEIARWMRTCAELEHHGREAEPLDRGSHGLRSSSSSRSVELTNTRIRWSGVRITARSASIMCGSRPRRLPLGERTDG